MMVKRMVVVVMMVMMIMIMMTGYKYSMLAGWMVTEKCRRAKYTPTR